MTGHHKRAIEVHFDSNPELEAALRVKGKHDQAEMVQNILPEVVECVFVRQPEQLWLGHAVLCAERVVGCEPFAVLLADDFILEDVLGMTAGLINAYERSGKSQLSVIRVERDDIAKYGAVVPGSDKVTVLGLIEKPKVEGAPSRLASIGRYVLAADVFQILRAQVPGAGGEIQLADAIDKMARERRVGPVPLSGQRFNCGYVDRYLNAISAAAKT